ncbi:YSIRK-type signal peptide-containing protein [Streptococcus pluranimalium]|uniref:YSIRK-type signal peptide-containing protein n=1 Tax=Streptococcus hyovaginalis TaxID=149015 RepID=UPI003AD37DE0
MSLFNKNRDLSQASQRYSIKKFKFGAASVLVGLSFLGYGAQTVLAETPATEAPAPAEEEPVAATPAPAEEEPVAEGVALRTAAVAPTALARVVAPAEAPTDVQPAAEEIIDVDAIASGYVNSGTDMTNADGTISGRAYMASYAQSGTAETV